MSPLPTTTDSDAPRLRRTRLAAAGTTLRPLAAGVGQGARFVAPHARRAGDRLRAIPAVGKALDAVGATWAALVEAFCATIEPLLARRFPEHRLVVTLAEDGERLDLHRLEGGGTVALGPLDTLSPDALAALAATRWTAVELRLPSSRILERRLTLPSASREFLAPILEHRLERLTPWRPDRVLYGFKTADAGASAGTVAVAVTATSRDVVAGPMRRLGDAGLPPTAIGADNGVPSRPLDVDLLGGGSAPPRAESRRFVSRAALATLGALFVLFVVSALVVSGATAQRDASAATLGKARRLLRAASFGNLGTREQAMLETKQPARSTVVLVDTLATTIPPDTYLKDLSVAPDKVRLTGSSSNAPALVAKLEAAGLSNVRFTSTIARDKAGRDEFELSADRPMPKIEDAR